MSVWGKIIGGAAGFALGGPIGALVGGLAGHVIDVRQTQHRHLTKNVAFSVALIALAAKMAKADGRVTMNEVLAFREKVDIAEKDVVHVGRLWELARQTPAGFEGYAKQLAGLFGKESAILEQLIALLFHIARADNLINSQEMMYLEQVSYILGFEGDAFARLCMLYGDPEHNPYSILKVTHESDNQTIKQAWLRLVREHHPDRLAAEGLPPEFIRAANERLAMINTAYDEIKKLRGFK